MKKLLAASISIAMTAFAGQAIAGEYYYSDDYCPERIAYYDTVVHYHVEPVLTGYRTFARTYTVPVVTYKTYVRYHTVPIYTNVEYRTVHHYPVYEHYTLVDPDTVYARARVYDCCD